jgi:TusA-related sulfurtransferase
MAKRRMEELERDEALVVLATDPEAPIDLAAWALEAGHSYAEAPGEGAWTEYRLVKGGAGS